jgi:hypothetical protein
VAAFRQLVVMDKFGISCFGPAPRYLIEFVRIYADRDRDLDALLIKEAEFVFPVETP